VNRAFPIRQALAVLLAMPALYLTFVLYQSGNALVALLVLLGTCLGLFIYLSPTALTYRYLFPGFVGFGLFVIFPILYTVYISFTKYSSENLLSFDRAAAIFRNETFVSANAAKRFASEPFELSVGAKSKGPTEPVKLGALPGGDEVKGKPLETPQIVRGKLLGPLRERQFVLPDETILGLADLLSFKSRERLWTQNPDGTLKNKKDGTVIRPDLKQGFFVNDKGERVGVGFRTFSAFENYARILTDPRIQGPFVRIFLWTVAFSALSVLLTFSVGMLLAVILEQKDLRFRATYRTLFILPYAVPGILSILILKGLFNQEFGAVNALLKGIFGFAPEWETNPWGARAMILLVNLWLGYPYMMLICTGMLQSIPGAIYEASAIDGSNIVVDFSELTLPLVLPPMIPVLISAFAFNFNNFNLIFLLTGGGPQMVGGNGGETDLLVTYTFNIAFRDSGTNYGLASAIATLLFILVGFLAWVNLRFTARKAKI
jgi:maltose/maltodextrin transport system permease protein